MIDLHVIGADDWELWRELRLQALGEAPYAFSSKLADWQGKGDTEQRWRSRLSDVPFNSIAQFDGRLAGMVSGTFPNASGEVELISMWVAPFARGRGAGDALVAAVIRWARQQRANRVILAVREENTRAADLYRRHRFVDEGRIEHASAHEPPERRMTCRL